MNNVKRMAVVVGLGALLLLGAACTNGEAASKDQVEPASVVSDPLPQAPATGGPSQPPAGLTAPVPPVSPPASLPDSGATGGGATGVPAPLPAFVAPVSPRSSGAVGSPLLQVSDSQAGIWVTGQGSISLEPDLALLNIGVETEAKSVVDARDQAARAMDAVVVAVKAHGLTDRDIQTRSFSISPVYEFQDVTVDGRRTSRRVLVGYRVSNTASIKIRDLDSVGVVIDDVATAGGDATRINGISFTIDDPKPFMVQLREAAVEDALAKAQHLAGLTGVSLGRLVFISETGRSTPVQRNFGAEARFSIAAAPAPQTSVSGGELELSMSVQAVFGIQ